MTFKLKGLDSVLKQLESLGTKIGAKTLASGARQAFKPVLAAARALAPRDSGELVAAIRLTVIKTRNDDRVVVVGLRIGGTKAAKGVPPARRWHFVEFGTAHMQAHPFLRPAFDANAELVLSILRIEVQKAIDLEIAKGKR